jgi:hypothetical protein
MEELHAGHKTGSREERKNKKARTGRPEPAAYGKSRLGRRTGSAPRKRKIRFHLSRPSHLPPVPRSPDLAHVSRGPGGSCAPPPKARCGGTPVLSVHVHTASTLCTLRGIVRYHLHHPLPAITTTKSQHNHHDDRDMSLATTPQARSPGVILSA